MRHGGHAVSDKSAERVLVIPSARLQEIGWFSGFSPRVEHYLPRILEPERLSYRPRAMVEDDPTYKQLIPYAVLKWRDELFHYTRGKRATEARLQTLRSIGVGGHIEARDSNLYEDAYREAMFREVNEEVDLQTSYKERCIGLINDDSTPVGRVHLGIVHVFELDRPAVRRREQALVRSGFAPFRQLRAERNEFESWSQFVLDVLEP
jgi:predicted NUDIX family phosphoesterase